MQKQTAGSANSELDIRCLLLLWLGLM